MLHFKSLREQIGLINYKKQYYLMPQLKRISCGRLDATDEEVYEAAKAANVLEFVKRCLMVSIQLWVSEAVPYLVDVNVNG